MAQNIFNSVKLTQTKTSTFDMSHDVKFSCNMGFLVPVFCQEILPGDTWKMRPEMMTRFAPMTSPPYHRFDMSIHYFFVPNRILWENWEKFITNTPLASGDLPAFPTIIINTIQSKPGTLADYMGVPEVAEPETMELSALPFAAYQCIFNEYYRDQNLIDEIDYKVTDGVNAQNSILLPLRRRAWEHDYFTSALPWAQKGQAVDLPLGQVSLIDDWAADTTQLPYFTNAIGDPAPDDKTVKSATNPFVAVESENGGQLAYNPNGSLTVEPTTINDLRVAYTLQEWLEKAARGGSRYIENILVQFGVRSSDKRLNRPEYITGVKSPVVISEVLNTTGTEDSPQGNMAGHGIGVVQGKGGKYYSEEHGYIIAIASILPRTAYQQGIPKHFLKTKDPFQFYWPVFDHLGEQPIENREIFVNAANPVGTFGYTPRYAEYRFSNNRVAGDFKTTLNFWHAGRIFETEPMLNADFVSANPTFRIFAVEDPTEHHMWCHIYHSAFATRKMSKFATPTF